MSGPAVVDVLHVLPAWVVAALVGLVVLVLPGRPRPAADPGRWVVADDPDPVPGADPPLLLDLVAAVVSAGAPPVAAVAAVAAVLREAGGPSAAAAAALEEVASGAPAPAGSAGATPEDDPLAAALSALRRCLWIAEQTGAPVAALLTSAATELRRRRRRAGALAAARLGVRVVAPLGLCTLPAFGLLAVVPVLLSLGQDLLG